MDDAAYDDEDAEEYEETAYSEADIVEFHNTGPVETLADLDGEGQDQKRGQNVEERDDHGVSCPGEPQKNGVKYQDQADPKRSDYDEMEHLVVEASLDGVVPGKKIAVYA